MLSLTYLGGGGLSLCLPHPHFPGYPTVNYAIKSIYIRVAMCRGVLNQNKKFRNTDLRHPKIALSGCLEVFLKSSFHSVEFIVITYDEFDGFPGWKS